MPRTTTLECSGCPPLRALTFDALGLIKVVEARDRQRGVPQVVERWGNSEASKCVTAVSMIDRNSNPLLAVARKNNQIEILSPVNGDIQATISDANDLDIRSEENNIVGLHLFAKQDLDLASRYCTLLSCTTKGNASIRSVEVADSSTGSSCIDSPKTWNVCSGGNILCSKVDGNEKFALFGGKGVEINIWDLNNFTKIWNSKSPPKNSLGIFTPTWFTSATFLMKDDHRKFVAGTNSHQVRLYDISAQRRPVLSFDFRETPIKALAEDIDGYSIYIGNGSGDMASVDIRTGKMLGCFSGKCSGSIRSIVRHPELPVVASSGLDNYLRLWDTKTRQLLSAVFLKQPIMHVLFDSNFIVKGAVLLPCKEQTQPEIMVNEEVEVSPLKRKKSSRSKEHILDGSERKKRSKQSKDRKKSEGNDEHLNIASRDKKSKSASKKRNKSSIPGL
ncbi:WD repeat-containing protein 74 isoform X1 [Cajanus cajan]|uniref:WD repeat-containing protein 74 n=2 Tax=Cajanus cajan TaxID=3821 RepID=A0A151UCQ9_CAJCA|nr:WD repeat-containing protein 74 isoform X1 [Cajanus cajan]XP_020216767.1 WD repeat-containing protein 74 isoform X1 [Cajanus cajan]KYP77103.1 WD repeat-containing protein 74 [Cajanus cajan]